MILDGLLKTRSRVVLMDIINKNGISSCLGISKFVDVAPLFA